MVYLGALLNVPISKNVVHKRVVSLPVEICISVFLHFLLYVNEMPFLQVKTQYIPT